MVQICTYIVGEHFKYYLFEGSSSNIARLVRLLGTIEAPHYESYLDSARKYLNYTKKTNCYSPFLLPEIRK